MTPLGEAAASFQLLEPATGRTLTLADCRGEHGTLIAFICNHCPFVIHIHEGLIQLATHALDKGIAVVAISSNDATQYPQDGPEAMALQARTYQYPFPYLYDESQDTARAYRAACTPDFFLFDRDDRLFYRGQMDGARPGNDVPVTGASLREAIRVLLEQGLPPANQLPSLGCNIKWKQ
jgi:thiol-disulfide isomerase/thioredoxin